MANTQRSTVVGVFDDHARAQRAVSELKQAGFRDDQIGVMARDGSTGQTAADKTDTGTYAGEGAVAGAVTGAGVGALWAIGIAAGMLPAIGPVIAGGIFASILASAAGAGVAGGLVGALIGLGIPEDEARYYESEFHGGRTVVTVRADNRAREAWTIMERHGAYSHETRGARGHTGEQTMRLHEEQLEAHKRPVETGEVRLRKEVHTEHQTFNVPVQREEVVIERHPVSGQASSAEIRPGQEVRIPVREEEVDVQKRVVAREEVSVGKRVVQDTEQVSGVVRKEEAKVEQTGDVDVTDAGSTTRGRKKT